MKTWKFYYCVRAQSHTRNWGSLWIRWPRVVVLCRSITNAWWWMHIDCFFFHNNIDAVKKHECRKRTIPLCLPLYPILAGSSNMAPKSFNLWTCFFFCFCFVFYFFRFKAIYFNLLLLVPLFKTLFFFCYVFVFFGHAKRELLAENREKVPDKRWKWNGPFISSSMKHGNV